MNEASPLAGSKSSVKKLDALLDDLSSRFIINCPEEELVSFERICFQIEQAHWFYEDFYREQDPKLPSYSLKVFARLMFEHCPILRPYLQSHSIDEIFESFRQYKTRVPVCGAILLNPQLDKCLLVKGWHSRSSWGFPKGKINKDEPEIDCARREVLEETGYIIPPGEINDNDFIEFSKGEQKVKLYIVTNVPEDTNFAPKTRKEISKIKWHPLGELPTYKSKAAGEKASKNYFMVVPVVSKLHHWVRQRKKGNGTSGVTTRKRSSSLTQRRATVGSTPPKAILMRKDKKEADNRIKIEPIVPRKGNAKREEGVTLLYREKQKPAQQQQAQPTQQRRKTVDVAPVSVRSEPSVVADVRERREVKVVKSKEEEEPIARVNPFLTFQFNYDEILACLPPPPTSLL